VVPAGLDCTRFKPAEKNEQVAEKLGISKDLIRILFVGRLVPEKGIFDLLNAFSILLRNVQNVELLIVGSGSSSMQIQISQLVENLKIGGKVKFLGSIEYSNMPQIHNLADVFCLPSIPTKTWAEQFGYSMVEAMACGKPVVSTSTGSIPEVVKDRATGILVKPNDPRGLESALEELILNKQERDAFGRNAREWVLQKFEANKVAGQLANIYSRFV
jgi:glycosyltransferase involved in cell wall biosynthesis